LLLQQMVPLHAPLQQVSTELMSQPPGSTVPTGRHVWQVPATQKSPESAQHSPSLAHGPSSLLQQMPLPHAPLQHSSTVSMAQPLPGTSPTWTQVKQPVSGSQRSVPAKQTSPQARQFASEPRKMQWPPQQTSPASQLPG
jgi:hypothetical protein